MSKVMAITGASKGIGAATAVVFAKDGYDVVLNYHSDDEAAKKVASEIEAAGQRAVLVKANIFEARGVEQLFEVIRREFGKLDVLINNAGKPVDKPFGEWTYDSISEALNWNFTTAALCTQSAVTLMAEGGSIAFLGSIYGLPFGGSPNLPFYSAGKAATVQFMQAMAERLAPKIRCNAVVPGSTKTPHWDNIKPEYQAISLGMTIQKEWVQPEEIASALLFFANTPHITAQTIVVDGGWQKKIRS